MTREDKLALPRHPFWTVDESIEIERILFKKDYHVIVTTTRLGCDCKEHDAWIVPRRDVGIIVEQLFRQRIAVEVEAEGNMQAAIIFVYDYAAEDILRAVRRFRKVKK